MINKNTKNMNESMFSAIDLIRQDSKDVRDFVKKVFSDKEFKSMSKDTDFIKYLKSIYEGTMIDEESVYISTRNSNGTITTHIKESVVKEAITPPNSKKVEALKKAVQKINRKYKVQISTHPVTKGKVEIELGDGNHPDRDYHTIDKLVKKLGIKNYSVFNEATFRPNSGTMSGGTYGLDNRKYELKRDVKGVRIGDYTNVTLPKGTIIYNLPGGLFAHHRSLKSYESRQNKYFNQSTFRGISVRQEKNTVISIEKNSKILESVNESKYKVGDTITVTLKGGKKVIKGKVEKINPLKIRTSPSDVQVLGNHLIKKVVKESVNEACWDTHKKVGMKTKGGKQVPNCVPKGESVVNEASIKGKNNKTGEAFGMVIGSDKKNREGEFEATIRITYSSRISSYKFMFDKGSNLIAIKDYGYSMDGKFPDMKGGGSVKSVRPNPRETITQIAKLTSPAFAKKIYQHVKKVNESTDGVPQGYNPMVEDKNQIKDLVKKVKQEKPFYDVLDTMEKKYGKNKYRTWLEKSLKDFGVNSKHYDYRTNAGAEEKLYQLGKK